MFENLKRQHESEKIFHDNWSAGASLDLIDLEATYSSLTSLENNYILQQLGTLKGKKVLDVGCGLGESSVMFAMHGAEVIATDISTGMLEFCQQLGKIHGVNITTITMSAEGLELPDAYFDVIYAANLIHHLADKNAFYANVKRLLKPTGVFCSWDPVKYNPVINIYRWLARKVRTEDEAPIGIQDILQMRRYFGTVQTRHFWFLAQALFLKYFFVDRLSINDNRYWKLIYSETPQSLWWWIPLEKIDRVLLRFPILKWLSWNVVVIARNYKK